MTTEADAVTPNAILLAALRDAAARNGVRVPVSAKVLIVGAGGAALRLSFGAEELCDCESRPRPAQGSAAAGEESDIDVTSANVTQGIRAAILKAVGEYDGADPLTADVLAPLAGYDNNAYFRRVLGKMVREELLGNDVRGYHLPE